MTTQEPEGLSMRTYLGVISHWKWLIIAVTLLVGVAGGAYAYTRTPMYSSTGQMLYAQQVDIGNPLGQSSVDQTQQQSDISSVPALLSSSAVAEAAQTILKDTNVAPGYSVSAVLQTDPNNAGYTNVVGIRGVSRNPDLAAAAANAYSQAFIGWRRDNARARVTQAIQAVQSRLSSFTTSASKLGSDYSALQQRLQDLQLLQASVTGDFAVITPASASSVPFSPRKTRSTVLALAVGLVLGLGLAFLIEQLDTRVRDDEQVADTLGLTVLSHVPPLARSAGENGAVQMLVNPAGPVAEAFRVLRSNLDFMGVDGDVRSLVVSSSVQAEGKSVTACNLAVSLALAGKRVVLVDADLRRPRVHSYLGLPNGVGLSSVIARRVDLESAVVSAPLEARVHQPLQVRMPAPAAVSGLSVNPAPSANGGQDEPRWSGSAAGAQALRVLPSGPVPPNPGEMVASRRLAEVIDELVADADLVIIDAPAMLAVGDTAAVAACADAIVFVANPARLKRPMLEQARAQLAKLPCRKLGLVLISDKKTHPYYGYHHHGAHEAKPARGRT
jgi:Mrp family chromosome partitioning ATPase/capsular polysaccharide biosynthesis protein